MLPRVFEYGIFATKRPSRGQLVGIMTHSRLFPRCRLSLHSAVHIFPFIVLDVLFMFYGRARKRMDHVLLTSLSSQPVGS